MIKHNLVLFSCIFLLVSCTYDQQEILPTNVTSTTLILIVNETQNESQSLTANESERETTHFVDILYEGFDPASITINKGDTVVWLNTDRERSIHSIVVFDREEDGKRNSFRSSRLFYLESFNHTYTGVGKYIIVDEIFENENDKEMFQGTVVVT